jgi:hypothetical protein
VGDVAEQAVGVGFDQAGVEAARDIITTGAPELIEAMIDEHICQALHLLGSYQIPVNAHQILAGLTERLTRRPR